MTFEGCGGTSLEISGEFGRIVLPLLSAIQSQFYIISQPNSPFCQRFFRHFTNKFVLFLHHLTSNALNRHSKEGNFGGRFADIFLQFSRKLCAFTYEGLTNTFSDKCLYGVPAVGGHIEIVATTCQVKVLIDGVHDELVAYGHVEELEFDVHNDVVATGHVEVLDKVVDVGHVEILQLVT